MGRVAKKRKKLKTHDLFNLGTEDMHNDDPDAARKKRKSKQRKLQAGSVSQSEMGYLKPSMFLQVAQARSLTSATKADEDSGAASQVAAAAAPKAKSATKTVTLANGKVLRILGGKGQIGAKKKKKSNEGGDIVDDEGKATGKLRRKNLMKERKLKQQEKKRGLGPRAEAAAKEKLMDFKEAEILPFNALAHRPPSFKFKGGTTKGDGMQVQTGSSTIAAARLEAMAAYRMLKEARSKQ